jgi:hypothetical protein
VPRGTGFLGSQGNFNKPPVLVEFGRLPQHDFVQDEQDAFQELPSAAIEELESRKEYIPGKVTLILIPMLLFGST